METPTFLKKIWLKGFGALVRFLIRQKLDKSSKVSLEVAQGGHVTSLLQQQDEGGDRGYFFVVCFLIKCK